MTLNKFEIMIHKVIFSVVALLLFTAFRPFNSGYEVGDAVTDFKLKNTDNKWISLSDYKNSKGVILIFDCNTCPYSKAYNDRIISLNKNFSVKGFPVVAVNSNDPQKSPGDSFEDM